MCVGGGGGGRGHDELPQSGALALAPVLSVYAPRVQAFAEGETKPYVPRTHTLSLGASALPPLEVPAEDR